MPTLVYLAMLGVITLETNAFLMNLFNPMNPSSHFESEFEPGEGLGFGMPGMGGGGMMGNSIMGGGGMMGNSIMGGSMMGRGGRGMFNPMNEMSDKMQDMYQLMALLRHSGLGGKTKTGGTPIGKSSTGPPAGRPTRPRQQRGPNTYCMYCMMTMNDCAQTACMFNQFNNMRF